MFLLFREMYATVILEIVSFCLFYMKYRAFLSLTFIFFSILPSYVHANLDTTGKVEYSYTCENGIGILKVQSLS